MLQKLVNPGNMGVCVACFVRDITGAVGLHRAEVVQYARPEIIGFVLGSLLASLIFNEYRPRLGSAPVVRFVLGAFAMIGALVFLGCPWRAALRLAGGDGTAILGLLGLAFGIWIGALFLKNGYSLGRTQQTHFTGGTDTITIMVDNETAKENVCRAAAGKGWTVADIRDEADGCGITIRKG